MHKIKAPILVLILVAMGIGDAFAASESESLRSDIGGFFVAAQKQDVSAIESALDHTFRDHIGRGLSEAINPKWTIKEFEILKTDVLLYGKNSNAFASVVVEVINHRSVRSVEIMYLVLREDKWKLLNFPFSGSGIPDSFPFITKSLRSIMESPQGLGR